jgi:radical SAM protein with 4Fe4S-binding SPASM domain
MLENSELDHQNEFYFQWHITDRCNLRCKHCYHDNYQQIGLDISQLLKIGEHLCGAIKEWGKIGSFSITGGEPFIRRDDVMQLLDFFDNREEIGHIDILTNGTLIDQKIINNLNRYKKIRRIQFSLEGLEKTNDKIRGKGSFDVITSKIKQLTMSGLKTSVMMTIAKYNRDEVIPLAETLAEVSVEYFILDRFIPEGQSADMKKAVLDSIELKEIYQKCYSYFKKTLKPRMLLYRTLFCLLNPEDKHIGAICSVGNNALTIMPNGDVFPCRRLPIKLGNILKNSVYEIWYTHPILWEFRDPNNLKGKCKHCEYIPVCRGCRAFAYAITGDYFEADPQCWKDNN